MIRTIALLLFLTTSLMYGNAKIIVTGKILQKETNAPLEYAIVSFTETGQPNPTYGEITDENGFFSIEVEKGTYTIKIEFMGFKQFILDNKRIENDLDLGILYLSEDVQSLDEVVVKSEKGLFENKLDKKIYNIGQDLTAQSTNVLQALNNVSSVSVSVDGGITLRGNSNVRILVNGKPSGLVGISDAQGLERLSTNAVEHIEIITNPSARYDAEGAAGIINIILKKGRNLGFNGSAQVVMGVPETFGIGGSLNYRTTKFNVFANLNFEDSKRPGNESVNTTFFDETTGTATGLLTQSQDITRGGSEYTMALGVDYYFNEKNTLTFMGLYANEDNDNNGLSTFNTFDVDGTLISTRLRDERELEKDASDEYTLTYKSIFDEAEEHLLVIESKYDSNTEIESAIFHDTYSLGNFENAQDRTASDERQRNLLIQADYVFPFSETGSFEAGYRSTMRTIKFNSIVENFNTNTGIWELDTNLSNRMDYGEDIYAAYSQYANAFGKFTILAGLRLEITNIDVTQFTSDVSFGKNYSNLFPSFHLGYQLTETSELKTSYGRRISRPSFRELNPFSGYSNDLNFLSGNPDLDPVFTNSFELGYAKNWDEVSVETIGYFQYSEDIVQLITTNSGMVNEENIPILITRPLNVGTENRYGIEVSSIYSPANWLRVNGTVNWYRFEQNASFNNTIPDPNDSSNLIKQRQSLNTTSASWFARLSPKVTLPKDVDLQIGIQYDAPFKEANTTRRDILVANVSANKELFKGRGAINLTISDLFNSRTSRRKASNTSFLSNSKHQYFERQINLTFTYRFKNTIEHRDDGDDDDDEDYD
ncbi:TonB-dependent receptor [Flavivirga sp. 57AJ16]|uniref:TonB-dependent receptor domain-containing protein n=1 Tax=Flavivirga sp. 57AJ16 TaxID=3025307 RepID=UPI002366B914|nr:TonB-dependent receptor [Flavivirga sp. 57AJ16]MDD7888123.1 TonB-dependent receptor [Flavivirga sp. 57AJ16]